MDLLCPKKAYQDCCVSPKPYSEGLKLEAHTCKKRKVVRKTVVTVKINEETTGKSKNGGAPSDLWSWRKYGQKPIKGSPHPRGYYRCSTSKGCSAKKQVERSKTDASLLVITYTCDHNHPGPSISDIHPNNSSQEPKEQPPPASVSSIGEEQKLKKEDQDVYFKNGNEDQFQYISSSSPLSCSLSNNHEDPLITCLENTHKENPFCLLLDEEPISCSHLVNFKTTPTSEENDFFDELEELLPMSFSSSCLTSFTGSSFSNEGIPVVPSWSQ